jgi:hypothetical protein
MALCLLSSPGLTAGGSDGYIYKGDKYIGEIDTDDVGDLARAAQNPIADLISVPFQNNTNFEFGPRENTQNVLNIQPVVPVDLNDDWLMITRTIIPVVSQPALGPGGDRENGIGDSTFTAFFSPKSRDRWLGNWLWGAGPVLLVPTNTDDRLGPDEWGAGLSALALSMPGNWVIGALASNVWGEDDVNILTFQYFVNYNLSNGWYLTTSPTITANWDADNNGDRWTVPVGGGFGRVFLLGGQQPVNMSLQGFYNLEKPENVGPEWSLRGVAQFMFPIRKT